METPMKPENDVASRKNPENNTNNITQTVDEHHAQPMEQKKASRKRIYNVIDAVLNHPDVCTGDADYLEEEVKRLKKRKRKTEEHGEGDQTNRTVRHDINMI